MMLSSSSATSHSAFDFKTYLEERRVLVEAKLDEFLAIDEPEILWESMRYSALGAGKRIRALLSIAAYETIKRINARGGECGAKLNCDSESAGDVASRRNAGDASGGEATDMTSAERAKFLAPILPVACAIEMVHAMSLVHDDLPCLDNDDVRRGKPTNHKAYGEAMALLAGDALLMRAIEILICSRDIQSETNGDERALDKSIMDITRGLARATGAHGMVGGQVFDLVYTGSGTPIPVSKDRKPISEYENNSPQVDRLNSNSMDQFDSKSSDGLSSDFVSKNAMDQSKPNEVDQLSRGQSKPISVDRTESSDLDQAKSSGMDHSMSIGMDQSQSNGMDQSSLRASNTVARSEHLDETVIRKIHAGKTGALLRFSLWSGARLAQASAEQLAALEQFGDIVGLAFQITDDLLDVTGDVETLGKTPGKDQAANKATWVSVFGIDGAREKLHILEDEGKKLLQAKGLAHAEAPVLESLLAMAIHRRK